MVSVPLCLVKLKTTLHFRMVCKPDALLASGSMHRLGRFIFLSTGLCLTLACVAQIRNGDQIQTDAHFIFTNPDLAPSDSREIDNLLELQASSEHAAMNDRALLLIQDLQIDRGEILFFEILSQNVRYLPAYWNLGRLYALLGEKSRADRIYRRAVLQSGLNSTQLHKQALLLDTQNRAWEAKHLQNQLFNERHFAASGLWLAALAYTAGDSTLALHYYESILYYHADESPALWGAGLIYYKGKNYKLAESYLARALKSGSHEPALILILARSRYLLDRLNAAIATIKNNLPAKPDQELVAFYGDLLLEQDFSLDVRFLLRHRPEVEHAGLIQHWYGQSARLYLEFTLPEFQNAF